VPYRQKLNFTFDALRGAVSALERLESLETRLGERAGAAGADGASEAFRGRVEEARRACGPRGRTTSTARPPSAPSSRS
jgi:hypothetical protein